MRPGAWTLLVAGLLLGPGAGATARAATPVRHAAAGPGVHPARDRPAPEPARRAALADGHAAIRRAANRAAVLAREADAASNRILVAERRQRAAAEAIADLQARGPVGAERRARLDRALATELPILRAMAVTPIEVAIATHGPSDQLLARLAAAGMTASTLHRLDELRQDQAEAARSDAARQQAARSLQAELDHRRAIELAAGQARDDAADATARLNALQKTIASKTEPVAAASRAPDRPGALVPVARSVGAGSGPDRSAMPVAGPIVERFGEAAPDGVASGLTIASRPGSVVASPCRGQVDFAGTFRSYGRMVIIDCGHGYRFVLAGLDRIDAKPGTAVGRGAPVGRMPAGNAPLFVQLRRQSVTVDPASFLR